MTAVAVGRPVAAPVAAARERTGSQRFVQVLMVLGVFWLAMQAWTWIAWIATGPVQIDRYRDTSDVSWKLAWMYEGIAVALGIGMAVHLVRQCRREHRITFDAKLAGALLLCYWLDPAANAFLPTYTYSSQWINLNEWVGQLPWVRNPDGGRTPEPMLFLIPVYFGGWLLFAMLINGIMRKLRAKLPTMGGAWVFGVAAGVALVIDVCFELPMFAFNLWSNQGAPRIGFLSNGGKLYPFSEMLIAVMTFSGLAALRYYRNDKGETIVERGFTATTSNKKKQAGSFLALIGLTNTFYVGMSLVWTLFGFFSGPWHAMKPWVGNAICDSPGVTGTRYGACPGSPGYTVPIVGSRPGSSPSGSDAFLNGPTQCATCGPVTVAGAKP